MEGHPTQLIIFNELHLFSLITAVFADTSAALSASTFHSYLFIHFCKDFFITYLYILCDMERCF